MVSKQVSRDKISFSAIDGLKLIYSDCYAGKRPKKKKKLKRRVLSSQVMAAAFDSRSGCGGELKPVEVSNKVHPQDVASDKLVIAKLSSIPEERSDSVNTYPLEETQEEYFDTFSNDIDVQSGTNKWLRENSGVGLRTEDEPSLCAAYDHDPCNAGASAPAVAAAGSSCPLRQQAEHDFS